MGAFDAVMWGVEGDPLLRSVITVVVELDTDPDPDVVIDRVERMSLVTPKLRQRAIGNPLSLLPPRWETDQNFDLSYHLRWERVPGKDAGLSQVLELAETISEQDFDRARPLWEVHIVTGLEDGRAAFIIKIHHAITDGVGGLQMAASLFDLTREPNTDLPPKPEAPEPHHADTLSRLEQGVQVEFASTFDDVRSSARGLGGIAKKAVKDPLTSVVDAQEWAASAGRLLAPASEPLSDLWVDRSLSVAFSVVESPIDALKKSAKAVGGTLNDAFMAAVTGGLAMYHEAHGSNPDALRVNMPINVRTDGDNDGGNRWVPARFVVPVNVKDAADRMKQLHPILNQARTEPALPLSDVIYKLLTVLPRPVTTSIAGGLMKGTDFAATNVPGPPIPVYFAGAEVDSMIPFAPKAGAAVNIGLMSYNGSVFLGINIDRGAVEFPDELTDCLAEAMEAVIAVGEKAAKKSTSKK
jgi:WS/DGAT/MGAT family acyltransferase